MDKTQHSMKSDNSVSEQAPSLNDTLLCLPYTQVRTTLTMEKSSAM